jgi:hypothetical protein
LVFHFFISLSTVFICRSSWILWLFMYQGGFRMDRRVLDWKRWRISMVQFAEETEVLGEHLSQCHFVHHKSHSTWAWTRAVAVGSPRYCTGTFYILYSEFIMHTMNSQSDLPHVTVQSGRWILEEHNDYQGRTMTPSLAYQSPRQHRASLLSCVLFYDADSS